MIIFHFLNSISKLIIKPTIKPKIKHSIKEKIKEKIKPKIKPKIKQVINPASLYFFNLLNEETNKQILREIKRYSAITGCKIINCSNDLFVSLIPNLIHKDLINIKLAIDKKVVIKNNGKKVKNLLSFLFIILFFILLCKSPFNFSKRNS